MWVYGRLPPAKMCNAPYAICCSRSHAATPALLLYLLGISAQAQGFLCSRFARSAAIHESPLTTARPAVRLRPAVAAKVAEFRLRAAQLRSSYPLLLARVSQPRPRCCGRPAHHRSRDHLNKMRDSSQEMTARHGSKVDIRCNNERAVVWR